MSACESAASACRAADGASHCRTVKSSTELVTRGQQPTHRRIFEGLREQIQSGRYVPGTQLPGTRELAVNWQTSIFTVHTALRALAKEGWIDRRPNAGTYIADPRSRFLCAAIYHASDISSVTNTAFARYLHFALLERLEARGKRSQVFSDSRPTEEQGPLFPPLAEAIAQKRVQCVIAPKINPVDAAALARLSVPTAFLSNSHAKSTVDFNIEQLFRESIRRLAAQGCRSAGLISNVSPGRQDALYKNYYAFFQRAVEAEGLVTREDWIRRPTVHEPDLAARGYREFKTLWSLSEKPDGLIVWPDAVAQGAIIAILELGADLVLPRIKFIFHRNAHLPFLCPFPVTWAVSDEGKLADGLVELIEKQFAGEAIAPSYLDYEFSEGPSVTAQL
jgi:DNA-binding LacI/PurR family transcriptional regulator